MSSIDHESTVAACLGAVIAVLGAVVVVVDDELSLDGRSFARPRSRRYSMRHSLFSHADLNSSFDQGWFRNTFRCSKNSFESICRFIKEKWHLLHAEIGPNAVFSIRDRVAVTLFYLTHPGSHSDAAQVFGMSKTSSIRFIRQITEILIDCMSTTVIRLPNGPNDPEWDNLATGFEQKCGFPNCCLAVDGSLFQIERPDEFFGWYCRKGYPAINAQLVVDHKCRIRSYDMRPGSCNDKAMFTYSCFGQILAHIIPAGRYIVADAGYTLSKQVITPFPEKDQIDPRHVLFNYLHSRTRITVERTIGILKNRFRILKMPLNQNKDISSKRSETVQMARTIEACLVLHNVLIDLKDDSVLSPIEQNDNFDEGNRSEDEFPPGDAVLLRKNIADYLFDNRTLLKQLYG